MTKKKLHKETEDLKINKQAEMKSTITEIKNSLEGSISRIQETEGQKSEIEGRLVQITDVEQKKGKKTVYENSGTTLNTPTSAL